QPRAGDIHHDVRPCANVRPLRQAGAPHDTRPGDPADPCSESGAGAEATTGPGTGPTRSLSAAKTEAGYFSSAVAPASFSLATAFSASALMPNSSSMAFTASTTSRMLQPLRASTKSFGVIFVAAIPTLPPVLSCTPRALRRAAEAGFA